MLLNAAIIYNNLGLSVTATDSTKISILKWTRFQERKPTYGELKYMFGLPTAYGIAVICGRVSGNLEVIDVDLKYDLTGTLLNDFFRKIQSTCPGVLERMVIASTVSGGYHLIYRCAEVARNMPLARRHATEEEKRLVPKEKVKVLIETRGEGGYFIAAPTKGYGFIQHTLATIPVITKKEREQILGCARLFNQYQQKPVERKVRDTPRIQGDSPLNDYNNRGDPVALLVRHGWTVVRETPERTFLKRPGTTDSFCSGNYHHGLGLFAVFSTSTEFEPGQGYRPAAIYAMLECFGDFKLATKRLAAQGYGQQDDMHRFRKMR